MAGGVGSRFWPRSRRSKPKQFLDIFDTGKSFIRLTFERFAQTVPVENFMVVTNMQYREQVLEHLPELAPQQVLCEPIGRNTAPCICYAAYSLLQRDPEARMVVTPADHMILDETTFRSIIGELVDFVGTHDVLMTVGITPSRPETGYGYIQKSDAGIISRVKCFTEKPDAELARTFVQCGEFFWNSGIFVWKVRDIVAAVEQVFSVCRAISIDYGVMEKADNVYVRCGDFGWSDVGTWGSLYQLSRKDEYANVKPAAGCFTYDTRNCIVSLPKEKIAVISGLKDYIVIDTDDALMICPRNEEQNIRKYIDDVKYKLGDKHV